jgi:hypothetical protein
MFGGEDEGEDDGEGAGNGEAVGDAIMMTYNGSGPRPVSLFKESPLLCRAFSCAFVRFWHLQELGFSTKDIENPGWLTKHLLPAYYTISGSFLLSTEKPRVE